MNLISMLKQYKPKYTNNNLLIIIIMNINMISNKINQPMKEKLSNNPPTLIWGITQSHTKTKKCLSTPTPADCLYVTGNMLFRFLHAIIKIYRNCLVLLKLETLLVLIFLVRESLKKFEWCVLHLEMECFNLNTS